MKTPTEVQADMIRELEAKVSLLLDDLFYARAEIAKMPSDIYLCPPTSENDYEGLKWCDAYEEVERENAALKQRILDDNKAYGCELMDPSGTIWDHAKRLQQENAALRSRCDELEAERTQFANRAARLFAIEHELEESRKAERLARVQLQAEREARK
jgi:hypothetical protein